MYRHSSVADWLWPWLVDEDRLPRRHLPEPVVAGFGTQAATQNAQHNQTNYNVHRYEDRIEAALARAP